MGMDFHGIGNVVVPAFMQDLERRKRLQEEEAERQRVKAEQEAERQRMGQEIQSMFSALGFSAPQGITSPQFAAPVLNNMAGQQQTGQEQNAIRQQSDAMKSDIKQRYGVDLPPNLTVTDSNYNTLIQRLEQNRATEARTGQVNQDFIQTYETMMPIATQYGIKMPPLKGRIPTQDEIQFFEGRINDAAGVAGQREMLGARESAKEEPPSIPTNTDMTDIVEEVRGAHRMAKTIAELNQFTSDPDYQNAMKLIEEWDRPYWVQLTKEYYAAKNALRRSQNNTTIQ